MHDEFYIASIPVEERLQRGESLVHQEKNWFDS